MPSTITFTFDLEDHRPAGASWPPRYPALTRAVLDRLDAHGVTATVFVVGELGEHDPDLVREVAARGHEIGLHNWRHVQLWSQQPDDVRAGVRRGRALLEDVTGTPVVGFRAPTGSLVPASAWAVELLGEEGFAYSSSVIPTRNPLNGFPGAPQVPFRYPGGLVEFPAPLAGLGPVKVPYLGGTYLRLLPRPVVAGWCRLAPPAAGAFLYCHPYDFDPDEPRWRVPDVGRLSPLLWLGRTHLWRKVDDLLAGGAGPPLRDRLDVARSGPCFDPVAAAAGARVR